MGKQGATIAAEHGLLTSYRQRLFEGQQRLADAKAGKGTEITACDLAGGADVLKDLALEFVKDKAAVRLKFQKAATHDEAIQRLDKGTTELLLTDGAIAERPHPGPLPEGEGSRSPALSGREKGALPKALTLALSRGERERWQKTLALPRRERGRRGASNWDGWPRR